MDKKNYIIEKQDLFIFNMFFKDSVNDYMLSCISKNLYDSGLGSGFTNILKFIIEVRNEEKNIIISYAALDSENKIFFKKMLKKYQEFYKDLRVELI